MALGACSTLGARARRGAALGARSTFGARVPPSITEQIAPEQFHARDFEFSPRALGTISRGLHVLGA
ncbi:hypothetical protein [Polyangium sp. 15x6]|uniref:hypothetical protein n=1 Tax=Polyangium sp. 15x6 TaxID=3042687 RepID=UPI002499C0B3|nr:hypothetical protein [Polyangium sp. 15x6]